MKKILIVIMCLFISVMVYAEKIKMIPIIIITNKGTKEQTATPTTSIPNYGYPEQTATPSYMIATPTEEIGEKK